MEVLADPDEGSKPSGLVIEALEDPDVGNKPRRPIMEAIEDPDQGIEVHGSNGYQNTISF